ncbi:MAG: hypothetical protein JWO44_640 [Bacteroidetes bacterium]|nr:hypothetical protein [Bacteroidota bacterium]
MNKLETTQRWLTSIIIRPGRLHEKIIAADKTYQLDNSKMIRASRRLSAEGKIHVYARGYVLRLMECMRADYPLLRNLMGEELFDTFAQAYLVQVPSHSASLFDLGENFPAFLKASQPPKTNSAEDGIMFDLPVELAQVERIRSEVTRSKGLEGMEDQLPEEDPLFYFLGTSSFRTSPCLRLLSLKFELTGFVKTVERGEAASTPAKKDNFLAISRKNYSVNMQELEAWQWHYLQELIITGDHYASAKKAAVESNSREEDIMADLLLWIPAALSCGYICTGAQRKDL